MEIKQKSAWDKLSMQEKAQLIKLSVDNGVSSLKQIRDTYNLYANGGQEEILNKVDSSNANFARNAVHWHDGKNGDSKLHISPVTTGGAGYIPPRDITDLAKGLAYNIMTQSALQNRSFSDIHLL